MNRYYMAAPTPKIPYSNSIGCAVTEGVIKSVKSRTLDQKSTAGCRLAVEFFKFNSRLPAEMWPMPQTGAPLIIKLKGMTTTEPLYSPNQISAAKSLNL